MSVLVLPDKYYLSHFFELISHLEANYVSVFESPHSEFLKTFRILSEPAQCLYVRMVNRKGLIFRKSSLSKYPEIGPPENALIELETYGFISPLVDSDKKNVIACFTKSELSKWLKKSGVRVVASESRGDLVLKANENIDILNLADVEDYVEFVAQRKFEEIDYLLFLYFGHIERNLSLYTLRDLGIRQTSSLKAEFKPRYTTLEEAKRDYFFSCEIESLSDEQNMAGIFSKIGTSRSLQTISSHTQKLKDRWLLGIAEKYEQQNLELTLLALSEAQKHPARERRARLFYKSDRVNECRILLDQMLQDPWCDEELLFAEDFFARKFDKKRIGYLTETLKNSKQLTLSDVYLKRPEQGVIDYFQKQGRQAQFTENYLWLGLFGLIFWDELFSSESASLFNPFERRPQDLKAPEFYQKHQSSIEKKLPLLRDYKEAELIVLKTVTQHYGKMNDLFQWNTTITPLVLDFLRKSVYKDVAHILRSMARRFDVYHSGYPDLMVESDGEISFVEVKAEGDSLKYKQLSKAKLLKEAGFEVEVLRVKWQSDPDQVYVVVDVETTGGSPHTHRITEIGAVKVRGGKIIDEFQTLINPERSIPPFISKLTGITDEMVSNAPTFSSIAEEFRRFTEESIFVAHNVRFDFNFIQKEFERVETEFVRTQLCTCAGMRKSFPGIKSYGLKNLSQHFQIKLDQHHRAMSDAKAATELLLLMTGYKDPSIVADSVSPTEDPAPRQTELN